MPQLNPTPWFFTMLMSWLIFTLIIQPKLLLFISPNTPSNKSCTATKILPWNWPWT